MIYLYSYYILVFLYFVGFAVMAYRCKRWAATFILGSTAIVFAATAGIIGLLHSWTGEGFGYFAGVLRGLGVAV